MWTIKTGTAVVVCGAAGEQELKKLTKDHSAPADDVVSDGNFFWFPLKPNSKGWVKMGATIDSVQVDAEPKTSICQRHGEPLTATGVCWECSMERDERQAERAEEEQVAQVARYKAQRDYRREPCGPNCRADHNADEPCQHAAPTLKVGVSQPAFIARVPGHNGLGWEDKPIKDGTYTVVFNGNESDYVTIRFDTATNKTKQDGSPNTWYGKQFVQYLSGSDNETDFQSFGTWESGDVRVWRKHQNSAAIAKYVKAALVVAASDDPGKFGEAYALRSGRCCICGRKLTVPASLHRGMGPVCAEGGRDA